MENHLFANSVDPDQTPQYVASHLGLHCLPIAILLVSRYEWVNVDFNLPVRNIHFILIRYKKVFRAQREKDNLGINFHENVCCDPLLHVAILTRDHNICFVENKGKLS